MADANRIRVGETSAVTVVNNAPAWLEENPFDRIGAVAANAIAAPLDENDRFFDFDPARVVALPDPFGDFV